MTSNVQPRSFNLELGREAIYNARLEINPPKILEKYLHNKNSKEQKELIGELALSLIGENENLENLKNVKAYLRVKAAKEVKANQDGIERLLNKLMNNTFKDNDQKSLKQKQGHESLESLSDQDRLDIPKGKFAELDMQALQDEKEKIIDKIKNTFLQSEKLQNYFSDQPNDFTNKLQQWCTEITNLKTTHEDELLAKNYVSRVLQALQAKNWDVLWNVNFKLLKNQLQILKGLFSLEQEVNSDIQAEIEQLADALAEIKDEIKQCRREIFEIDLEIRTKNKIKDVSQEQVKKLLDPQMEDLDQNPSDSSTQNNIPPKSEEENTENQTVSESPSPQENETPSTEEITGNKAPDVSTSVDPKNDAHTPQGLEAEAEFLGMSVEEYVKTILGEETQTSISIEDQAKEVGMPVEEYKKMIGISSKKPVDCFPPSNLKHALKVAPTHFSEENFSLDPFMQDNETDLQKAIKESEEFYSKSQNMHPKNKSESNTTQKDSGLDHNTQERKKKIPSLYF